MSKQEQDMSLTEAYEKGFKDGACRASERRFEAAKAAMQGLLGNPNVVKVTEDGLFPHQLIYRAARRSADEQIAELNADPKRGGKHD